MCVCADARGAQGNSVAVRSLPDSLGSQISFPHVALQGPGGAYPLSMLFSTWADAVATSRGHYNGIWTSACIGYVYC